ncbi:hypothetical protein BOX15_Mlig000052g5 [Macrostomum lignano]|uniref:Uncharacterized protein n=1 Tax=Macrostomum lignano TaxID=282301 RepID=A0A267DMX3_9PLAT|nr:hypothetical protein BOX15_Mlig000052g5 [Macrostomum lignano]
MASSKEARISSIVEIATNLSRKDKSLIGCRLKDFSEKELEALHDSLEKLDGVSEKKPTTQKRKEKGYVENVLETIYQKLEENEDRGVSVCVEAITQGLSHVGLKLEGTTKHDLIERFKKIKSSIEALSIAKAMMQFEQGRLIYYLSTKYRMTERELADSFNITSRKVEDYKKYYQLCLEYPGLIFSTYSMGIVINYSAAICKKANNDARFKELLKMQHETVALVLKDGSPEEKQVHQWYEDTFNEDPDAEDKAESAAEVREMFEGGKWVKK